MRPSSMFAVSPVRQMAIVSLVAIVATGGGRQLSAAEQSVPAEAKRAAARELEMAHLRLRRFMLVDHPLALRKLESAIKLTQAELDTFKQRLAEYEKLPKFKYSDPFLITLGDARLDVQRAELRLGDLQEEKSLLDRNYPEARRLLELEVESAAARLNSLK